MIQVFCSLCCRVNAMKYARLKLPSMPFTGSNPDMNNEEFVYIICQNNENSAVELVWWGVEFGVSP